MANPVRVLICVALAIAILSIGYVYFVYDGNATETNNTVVTEPSKEVPNIGMKITIGSAKVGSQVDNVDPTRAQLFWKIVVDGETYTIPDQGQIEYDRTTNVTESGTETFMTVNRSITVPAVLGKTYAISLFMKDYDSSSVADTIDLVSNDNLVSGVSLQYTSGELWNGGHYKILIGNTAPYGACSVYIESAPL
ncbi:MAG: hypothetical protein IJT54_08835 [Candidatus Methanomethylophilaceae archaeon]|nr:hypothetical protein [Candidatus Methanomethylophilaceae archaeon]